MAQDKILGYITRTKEYGDLCPKHVANEIIADLKQGVKLSYFFASKSGLPSYGKFEELVIYGNPQTPTNDLCVVKHNCSFPLVPISLLDDDVRDFNRQLSLTRWDVSSKTNFSVSCCQPRVEKTEDGFIVLQSYLNTSNGVCGAPLMSGGVCYGIHYQSKGKNAGVNAMALTRSRFQDISYRVEISSLPIETPPILVEDPMDPKN